MVTFVSFRTTGVAITIVTLGIGGCSLSKYPAPSPPEPLNPVIGTVNIHGKPAEGVRARFVKADIDSPDRAVACNTLTNSEGKFTCTTYLDLNGLPAGKYTVSFVWPESPSLDPQDNEVDKLAGRYGPQSRQQFTVEIKPGTNDLPVFNLK
jgi:hypothetical protein